MRQRTRTREKIVPGGSYEYIGNFGSRTHVLQRETMIDWFEKTADLYGMLPSTPCDHLLTTCRSVRLSGTQSIPLPPSSRKLYGLVCSVVNASSHLTPPVAHTSKAKSSSLYVNELLARTNPFRPEFSIPVALKEFAELVTMFSLAAKTFAGFIGGAYLNYRFGWLTFYKDVQTLSRLTKTIESRLKELRSLQQRGGLRRRVKLDSFVTRTTHGTWTINSAPSPSQVQASDTRTFKTVVYGSVRWFPAPGSYHVLENMTPLEEFNLVLDSLLDLGEVDAETLWNLVPFSWLADYFLELGSYLGATSGDLASPEHICLIYESVYERSGVVTSKPSWVSVVGEPRIVTVRTERTTHSGPSFPSQLSPITLSEAKVILALLAKFRG